MKFWDISFLGVLYDMNSTEILTVDIIYYDYMDFIALTYTVAINVANLIRICTHYIFKDLASYSE